MFSIVIGLWLALGFLCFGIPLIIYILMIRASSRPWPTRIDEDYQPKVSILIPAYNESGTISFKLQNLLRVRYPRDKMEIVVVDNGSTDDTVRQAEEFAESNRDRSIKVTVQAEQKGKSAALNFGLRHCTGEVVIVSDADCFWAEDILEKSLPFLADDQVGAISGPTLLMNPKATWVTRSEEDYMASHNRVKLGESKSGSTLVFGGGFSAFKRKAIQGFDPYRTGSDDSGTVIRIVENRLKALLVPDARYFTVFSLAWKDKLSVKIRRASQFQRVFSRYALLCLKRKITTSRRIVLQDLLLYLIGPVAFALFVLMSIWAVFLLPYLALCFLVFLIPRARFYFAELVQGYAVLLLAMVMAMGGKRILRWNPPNDRNLLTKEVLERYRLI